MKQSLLFLALLSALVASSQNKINMSGLQLISDYKVQQLRADSRAGMVPEMVTASPDIRIPSHAEAAVILKPGTSAEAIEKLGGVVEMVSDNIAVVNLPLDKASEIARLPEVVSISMGKKYHPLLNLAREAGLVNPVQTGTDLPQAYTGKGVLVSLMDQGLDPNHINFKTDNGNGASRVKRVWQLSGNGAVSEYDTPEEIAGFRTDDSQETHGTHVLGIMAGSYKGEGKYAGTRLGTAAAVTGPIPFYGVATDADIAVACGSFEDACLIKAARLVSDYAKQEGKPVVFNMSLGGNVGPHDGTDAVSQYLKTMGQNGAIICISAGNEGSDNLSLLRTFTAESEDVKTFPVKIDRTPNAYSGQVLDIWSDNSEEFTTSFGVYDLTSQSFVYQYDLDHNTEGEEIAITDNRYNDPSYIHNANFDKAFSGYVIMRSNLDPNNDRYQQYFYFNITLKQPSQYVPAIIITGNPGVTVNAFTAPAMAMSNRGIDEFTSGSPANSANDLACGDNTLAIGSFNSRKDIYNLNGVYIGTYPAGEVGDISSFSSYGSEINGKNIPTLCAPGSTLYSSVSRYYVNNLTSAAKSNLQAQTPATNPQYYWEYMSGTSMASPYAAGVVALMLEAVPTLTFDQVREALVNSAVKDATVTSSANRLQWGAGKIDAKAAVKYVLDKYSAIGDVFADDDKRLIITADRSTIDVTLAGEAKFNVRVVDLQGRTVASANGVDGNATVESSTLTPGFYIVNVEGSSANLSQKIAIR